MSNEPDKLAPQTKHLAWEDFAKRNVHAIGFEQSYIEEYCKQARSIKVPAQFVRSDDDEDTPYIVSFDLPNLPTISRKLATFLTECDELELCFEPFRSRDPETGQPCDDVKGWKGLMLGGDSLPGHSGTHVALVRRPIYDSREILSSTVWTSTTPYTAIYLKMKESTKTSRRQMTALAKLDPKYLCQGAKFDTRHDGNGHSEIIIRHDEDNEDDDIPQNARIPLFVQRQVDASNLRSILLGHCVNELYFEDFFGDLTDAEIHGLLGPLSVRQRSDLLRVLRAVPNAILAIMGAAGTGKTTASIVIMMVFLAQSKRGIVASATNAAVNNIAQRAAAANTNDRYLFIRLHPEQLESGAILRYDVFNTNEHIRVGPGEDAAKFYGEMSLACRILQLGGVLPTSNPKILSLRQHYTELASLLQLGRRGRDDEDKKLLNRLIKKASVELLTVADVVFSTTVTMTAKAARWFFDAADWTMIDEAGALSPPSLRIDCMASRPPVCSRRRQRTALGCCSFKEQDLPE